MNNLKKLQKEEIVNLKDETDQLRLVNQGKDMLIKDLTEEIEKLNENIECYEPEKVDWKAISKIVSSSEQVIH